MRGKLILMVIRGCLHRIADGKGVRARVWLSNYRLVSEENYAITISLMFIILEARSRMFLINGQATFEKRSLSSGRVYWSRAAHREKKFSRVAIELLAICRPNRFGMLHTNDMLKNAIPIEWNDIYFHSNFYSKYRFLSYEQYHVAPLWVVTKLWFCQLYHFWGATAMAITKSANMANESKQMKDCVIYYCACGHMGPIDELREQWQTHSPLPYRRCEECERRMAINYKMFIRARKM